MIAEMSLRWWDEKNAKEND